MVKCVRSSIGDPGLDRGCTLMHHFSSHAVATSHIQQLEECATMSYNYVLGLWREKKKGGGLAIDVGSELVFLNKERRIGMDVSSGLIFLTIK